MLLLRQIKIADRLSPLAGQVADLLIKDGEIVDLGQIVKMPEGCEEYDGQGKWVSPGFLDIGAYLGDPGSEDREDVESLAAAGLRGGYTQLAVLPNTSPVRQDKASVDYLRLKSVGLPVELLPLGAVTKDTAGKELTEMIDLHQAGVVGYTDGLHPIVQSGVMRLALEYVRSFEGTVINQPLELSLIPDAHLHEGELSTRLGMRGLPVIAETIPLQRDLNLLAYTESRLLVHLLSSESGLSILGKARSAGLRVYGSVSAAHLQFTVDALSDFDVNFKLMPPLRDESDRIALIEGVKSGVIQHVASHHQSHQTEAKRLEFPYAEFGSQFLETCVSQAFTVLGDAMSAEQFCSLFSHGPREALGMNQHIIDTGEPAELTLFDPNVEWSPVAADFGQKSVNTPMIGHTLKGRPVGTYHKNRLWTLV
ncbi:MAG: dihydroorotase [Bacteroidota bacterium]